MQNTLTSLIKFFENSIGDGASGSCTMTLPRTTHDMEHETHITNSLDKRSYVPGYMTTTLERSKHLRAQYGIGSRTQLDASMAHSMNTAPTPGAQTPENPYGYDSMPSNYRYVVEKLLLKTQMSCPIKLIPQIVFLVIQVLRMHRALLLMYQKRHEAKDIH